VILPVSDVKHDLRAALSRTGTTASPELLGPIGAAA
jgi:hypothetical protein